MRVKGKEAKRGLNEKKDRIEWKGKEKNGKKRKEWKEKKGKERERN